MDSSLGNSSLSPTYTYVNDNVPFYDIASKHYYTFFMTIIFASVRQNKKSLNQYER